MSQGAQSSPIQVLVAYSRKQATQNEVMRSLVSHRDWLAPAVIMAQHYGRNTFDNIIMFGDRYSFPPDELWLFTDQESAYRAQSSGAVLGPYACGIAGAGLFANLHTGWSMVKINPGLPAEMTWNIAGRAFDLARVWAEAVLFEQAVESWRAAGRIDMDYLRSYQSFLLLNHANGFVVTLVNCEGLQNAAAVFTAPDCLEAFIERAPEEMRAGFQRIASDGAQLIDKLPLQSIDGIILNAFGPGPSIAVPFQRS